MGSCRAHSIDGHIIERLLVQCKQVVGETYFFAALTIPPPYRPNPAPLGYRIGGCLNSRAVLHCAATLLQIPLLPGNCSHNCGGIVPLPGCLWLLFHRDNCIESSSLNRHGSCRTPCGWSSVWTLYLGSSHCSYPNCARSWIWFGLV